MVVSHSGKTQMVMMIMVIFILEKGMMLQKGMLTEGMAQATATEQDTR